LSCARSQSDCKSVMPLSNLPGPWVWARRNGKLWRVHVEQQIWDGPHDAAPATEPAVGMLDEIEHVLHRCSQFHLVTACGLELEHATVGPLGLLHLKSRRQCETCWPVP
jgi:hypothetical protein